MNATKINAPWVLFEIDEVIYSISSESVLSINQLSQMTQLPMMPPEIKGVINFRGKIIQLIDTRSLLNIKTITQEITDFSNIIDQRFNDHLNWLATLEKSVKENVDFTLTTDPHKCAFGKWYDNFKLKNSNIMFESIFGKFDKPHKAIHKIGITAKEMVEQGKREEAVKLIEAVKNTELKQMFHLFDDIKDAYKESLKETVLVLGNENEPIGITVDKITAIENLFEIDEDFIKESLTSTEYLAGIAKNKNGSIVLLLNDEYILNKYY